MQESEIVNCYGQRKIRRVENDGLDRYWDKRDGIKTGASTLDFEDKYL
jgi:hypothetical protein